MSGRGSLGPMTPYPTDFSMRRFHQVQLRGRKSIEKNLSDGLIDIMKSVDGISKQEFRLQRN